MTHIYIYIYLTIIGSDNGLSPGPRKSIVWANPGIMLIGPLGVNCSEILIEFWHFQKKKHWLKMSSAKWRTFCLGLNALLKKDDMGTPKLLILLHHVWLLWDLASDSKSKKTQLSKILRCGHWRTRCPDEVNDHNNVIFRMLFYCHNGMVSTLHCWFR